MFVLSYDSLCYVKIYFHVHFVPLVWSRWDVLEGGSKEELAPGLFVTRSRGAGLDKMSPDRPGGFYLLVLGADNF